MKRFYSFLRFFFAFYSLSLSANVTILNGLTHIHNTEVVSTITGEIIIKNMSKSDSERIIIYLEDLQQLCSGKVQYVEAGNLERSIINWLEFSTTDRVLLPNETFSLVYTLSVPETLEKEEVLQRGSFWGAVMVEATTPINEEEQYGVQINSKIRYGIQLIVNLDTPENSEIALLDVILTKKEATSYALEIKLQNNGIYIVQPLLTLELFDQNGEHIKTLKEKAKKIYPDSCKDYTMILVDLPEGAYDGVLVADYGGEMFGINLELNTSTAE